MPDEPLPTPETPEEIAERLRRLEEEAAALREALQAKQTDAPAGEPQTAEPAPKAEESDDREPPDQETLEKIEKLLQRFRLESTRGNREIAVQFLEEAKGLGPRTSLVLEMLGDDALARGQNKDALTLYEQAKDALPKSLTAEKKHADLVFKMRAKSASLMMGSEFENVASAKGASVLSAIIPGAGHMVIGDFAKGLAYLAVWAGAIVWAVLTDNGIKGVVSMVSGKPDAKLNAVVFVPIFIAFVTWLAAMIDLSTRAKMMHRRMDKLEPPKPPVDLPY